MNTEDCVTVQEQAEEALETALPDETAEITEEALPEETSEAAAEDVPSLTIPDEERAELTRLFTEEDVSAVTEEDTVRYLALRTLGLSPKEAYLAANGEKTLARIEGKRQALARLFSAHAASKAHVTSAALGAAASASAMPRDALLEARALFSGMSDREIERLYARAKGAK